ncbi:ECF transporter S component [Phycicoccus sp. 3266]|uniref:ECF transporter S component n=1 Tax=Phycicoccus sp. 3266 TaxID=2817751 RepID=UPI002859FBF0|nr:ECF transporter S component [Phycicoccus sp. 3266]MDR6861831.1 energy-coupling factor transport system substrate-specific component [Phycicoccus sp. 3266]
MSAHTADPQPSSRRAAERHGAGSTPTRRARSAVALRPRSTAALALVSVAGLLAFLWPLLASADSQLGRSGDAPLVFALLLPLLLAVVLSEIAEGGLDVKAVAMLGVLSAVGAALRPLGAGTAGLETVFFLLVLGGRVFGPGFGFVLGSTTLFASALVTGGVGPWLPYQMLGAAWVGLGAGLLPRTRPRWEVPLLCAYGALAGLLYGVALDFSFWPFATGLDGHLSFVAGAPAWENLRRFAVFSAATSLWWDLGRAVTNVVLIAVTGRAVLATLRRAARRAAFDTETAFDGSTAAAPAGAPTAATGGGPHPDGEPAARHTLRE